MRKTLFAAAACATVLWTGCSKSESVTVTIANPLAIERTGEMVEIPVNDIYTQLNLSDTAQFVIYDEKAQEVPYQLTYDEKVVFPVSIASKASVNYTVQQGTPSLVNAVVYGRCYPERLDDIAWENDRAAYRAYGPALQKSGEKAYGYDVFTKSVEELVVEDRYAMELDSASRAEIKALREAGKKEEADSLSRAISYHIDHGNGMDCYAVGPTLGGGTAALMPDSAIVYPYCYKDYEILDNGPLRFTVKLVFNPLVVKNDSNVVETRIIQLDKGSQLNKTTVSYEYLTQATPVAAGLVLHAANPEGYAYDAAKGYISYADPTTNAEAGNGIVYVGAVFPASVQTTTQLFEKPVGDALGHVLGISTYEPGNDFVYYWGSGWSKYG
ncbi:DUF4861 domain-containing protein, partial [Phocaeicola plebeius]|uniref:DUF4861 domain-containing protein n=1 Tax=Phocaeicola plebeius TaxID=310297 RepID=UPI0026EDA02D